MMFSLCEINDSLSMESFNHVPSIVKSINDSTLLKSMKV